MAAEDHEGAFGFAEVGERFVDFGGGGGGDGGGDGVADWFVPGFAEEFAEVVAEVEGEGFASDPFPGRGEGPVTDDAFGVEEVDGEFDEDALSANNIRREDMIAKLREANVLQLSEVRAAILETTGDISVLHGKVDVDEVLLRDVRGAA